MANDKIILAYSGGLDTSVAVPWLKENYGADVITLTIDLGMVDLEAIRQRALQVGACKALTVDGRRPWSTTSSIPHCAPEQCTSPNTHWPLPWADP